MTQHYYANHASTAVDYHNTKFDLSRDEGYFHQEQQQPGSALGFLELLHKQIQSLCVCSEAEAAQTFVDASERYWNDMDASLNASLIANYQDMYYSGRFNTMSQRGGRGGRRGGGVEECKECLDEDMSSSEEEHRIPAPSSTTNQASMVDESMVLHQQFYRRDSNLFSSTAIGFDEKDDSIMFSRGAGSQKVRSLHCPSTPPRTATITTATAAAPATITPPMTPPTILRPRVALPAADMVLPAVSMEGDDSSEYHRAATTIPPAAAMFFQDIPFYTTTARTPTTQGSEGSLSHMPPPITSADTCTTVSTSRSDASLLDMDDEDDCSIVWTHRQSASPRIVAECFRAGEDDFKTPPQPNRDGDAFMTPPQVDKSRYLLRMKPSHYVHGDDWEDDCLFLSHHQMTPRRHSAPVATTAGPMMPDLR